MQPREENKPGSTQSKKCVKELIKMFVLKTFQQEEELTRIYSAAERAQGSRTDELPGNDWRKIQSTVNQLTVQIQELQDRVNFLNDSRDQRSWDSKQFWISPRSKSPEIVPSSCG